MTKPHSRLYALGMSATRHFFVSLWAVTIGLIASATAADPVQGTRWPDLMPPGEEAPLPLFGHPGTFFDLDIPEQPGTFNVNFEIVDRSISLEGFVVPLDLENGRVARFLLVPYFGACVHLPPPPPNQIVDVTPNEPLRLRDLSRTVKIEGRIHAEISHTELAGSAYSMRAATVQILK